MEINVFSERLKELRGSMSQAEFGKMCGISRVTVGFYENGERLPDARILAQIAQACNVTSDYLLGLSDLKSPEYGLQEAPVRIEQNGKYSCNDESRIPTSQSAVIANRLKALRRNKGLSHVTLKKELEKRYGCKISKDSLINYEVTDPHHTRANKNLGMSIKFLSYLADFYGVSTDYLLGMKEQINDSPKKGVVQMSNNSFRRSIDKYWHATLNIFFAEEPCCDRCPLLETYARKQCRVTGEYLSDTRFCGYMCPLIIGDEKTNARELMDRE